MAKRKFQIELDSEAVSIHPINQQAHIRLEGYYSFTEIISEPQPSFVVQSGKSIGCYSRQEVLCEKWKPNERLNDFYFIRKDNSIDFQGCFVGYKLPDESYGLNLVYSPTRELAEEIVRIREGKWLPKKGDRVFCSDHLPYDEIAAFDYAYPIGEHHYFSSIEQRDRFIREKKKEEPKIYYGDMDRICQPAKPDTYNRGYVDGLRDGRKESIAEIVKRIIGF